MEFSYLLDELKSSTKRSDKIATLEHALIETVDRGFFKFLVQEALDQRKLHNVVLRNSDIPIGGSGTLLGHREEVVQLFELLRESHSSAENKRLVQALMYELLPDEQAALLQVVNKKLKCGIGITTVNSVVKDLIPIILIQLAAKYSQKKDYDEDYWYGSVKLDGLRIFAIREEEHWTLYSRDKDYLGQEVTTLNHFKPELEMLYNINGTTFVDGEAYRHGMAFERIQSLVMSRVHKKDTTSLQYHIFAFGRSSRQEMREKTAHLFLPSTVMGIINSVHTHHLVGLHQMAVKNNPDAIFRFLERGVAEGYEGIVLRSSEMRYDFKRSTALLKLKTSDSTGTEEVLDCYVEGIESSDIVVRESGKEVVENLPVRLIVSIVDGDPELLMKVGSGFSLHDRRRWAEYPQLIVGKVIEAECQGRGANGRMRFPRYKRTREDL